MGDRKAALDGDARIAFMPSGRRGRFRCGTTLIEAARALGVFVESSCGGRAICGRCQITIAEGEFAKLNITSRKCHVSPENGVEAAFRADHGLKEGRRLACQTRLRGDVVVDVPAESRMHRQIVRKRAEKRRFRLDPAVRLYRVTVQSPDMGASGGDLEHLRAALARQHGVRVGGCALSVLTALHGTLREGDGRVTVAVFDDRRQGSEIIAVWPRREKPLLGLAVDLGSTTIAAHLVDLERGRLMSSAGVMNPQIGFGEDLMSRVSHVVLNPGAERELTRVARAAINDLGARLAGDIEAAPTDILDVVLVGNPVMHHLFFGIDPAPLGSAPFALATSSAWSVRARDVGLGFHGECRLHALPLIAGHVGADAAAVLLAEKPYREEKTVLVVDIGTNAEVMFGNSERLLAASSPTGPAFEGAELSAGQRAAPGVIERVRIDPETLSPRYKVIGCELWSHEVGFEDAVAAIGVIGICGSGAIEAIAELFLAGIIDRHGAFRAEMAARSKHIRAVDRAFSYVLREGTPQIAITQNDIRAIQLAKAALQATARLLIAKSGHGKVERIRLAGAFGSHIDPKYALVLGLLPDCRPEDVTAIGNAAGTGALMALQDIAARAEIEAVVGNVEKIETAVEKGFQDQFVAAMAIPHRDDPYRALSSRVRLPGGVSGGKGDRRRGRRRRAVRGAAPPSRLSEDEMS